MRHAPSFPLPADVRAAGERLLGYDLSAVRVHIGPFAPSLGCAALACGTDLHLAPGLFAPHTPWGRDLLLHELAHVAQQAERRVPGRGLVIDAALEAEADRLAAQAHSASARPLRPLPACGRDVLQPVVELKGGMASGTYQKGELNTLWTYLTASHYFTQQNLSQAVTKKVKTKLQHWVDAPRRATLFGKGHKKEYGDLEELARALIARVSDRDSKQVERRLATRIKDSRTIKRQIREFISGPLDAWHDQQLFNREFSDGMREGGADAGRYAFFYSPGLSALKKSKQRSLGEALTYMKGGDRSIVEMCSFLADYSLVARDSFSDEEHPFVLPENDARMCHFNVNEQSDWVKRARAARARLGAGPSATTATVLRVCRGILGRGEDEDITLLCVALGLFAFWNLEMSKLQMFSEIHTYHEVMLVAHGYGLPTVPALTGAFNMHMAEFEYPLERDIPA